MQPKTRRLLVLSRQMAAASNSATPAAPSMTAFNAHPRAQLVPALVKACHAQAWAERVADERPYESLDALISTASDAWFALGAAGAWTEAFAAHGSLGARVAEQANTMRDADSAPFEAANAAYEARHGHKCITFAANKSAERLLDEVVSRTPLDLDTEMRRCAEQTSLITALRLCRMVSTLSSLRSSSTATAHVDWPTDSDTRIVSPVTTHILDTSLGCPARGVTIRMERQTSSGSWCPLATGSTNSDGRVTDLLPGFYDTAGIFASGLYRLTFDVAGYYARLGQECFYPDVVISFYVVDPTQHYHVPLLLNPYGYSTYRGS